MYQMNILNSYYFYLYLMSAESFEELVESRANFEQELSKLRAKKTKYEAQMRTLDQQKRQEESSLQAIAKEIAGLEAQAKVRKLLLTTLLITNL